MALSNLLKTIHYRFIKTVLTGMTEKGALDDLLDRNIDRWTLSLSFMDAFTNAAMTSLRSMRLDAQIITTWMDETADERRSTTKTDRFSSAEACKSLSQLSASETSSDNGDCRKHCRKNRKASAPKRSHYIRKARPKSAYSTAISNRDTRTTSPGHNALISNLSGNNNSVELSQPLVTATE